jgi:hypothetical protein
MFTRRLTRSIALGVAAVAVGGGAYGIVDATAGNGSAGATTSAPPASPSGQFAPGRGSNARSGPAAGGAVGTVAGVSASGFTLTTAADQTVTVDTASSTTYKEGQRVLVLGTVNGTTITAGRVRAQPADNGGSQGSSVVPFQPGSAATSKQVGQVPADYRQGSGTIVSGAAASKATEAALAAYPGGIVDRVVKIGNGEYEVHNIGVSWPHHVFVDQSFDVVGAD